MSPRHEPSLRCKRSRLRGLRVAHNSSQLLNKTRSSCRGGQDTARRRALDLLSGCDGRAAMACTLCPEPPSLPAPLAPYRLMQAWEVPIPPPLATVTTMTALPTLKIRMMSPASRRRQLAAKLRRSAAPAGLAWAALAPAPRRQLGPNFPMMMTRVRRASRKVRGSCKLWLEQVHFGGGQLLLGIVEQAGRQCSRHSRAKVVPDGDFRSSLHCR